MAGFWNGNLIACLMMSVALSSLGRMLSAAETDRPLARPLENVALHTGEIGALPDFDFNSFNWGELNVRAKGFIETFGSIQPEFDSILGNFKKSMAFNAQLNALLGFFGSYSKHETLRGRTLPADFSIVEADLLDAFHFSKGLSKTFGAALSFDKLDSFGIDDSAVKFFKTIGMDGELGIQKHFDAEVEKAVGLEHNHLISPPSIRGGNQNPNFSAGDIEKSLCSIGDHEQIQSFLKKEFVVNADILQSLKFNSLKLSNIMSRQKGYGGTVGKMLSKRVSFDIMAQAFGGFSASKFINADIAKNFGIDMNLVKNMDLSAGAYLDLLNRLDAGSLDGKLGTELDLISGVGVVPGLSNKLDAARLSQFVALSDDLALNLDSLTKVNNFNEFSLAASIRSSTRLRTELLDLNSLFRSEGYVNFAVLDLLSQVDGTNMRLVRLSEFMSLSHAFPRQVRGLGNSFGMFGSVFSSFSAFSDIRNLSNFGLFDFTAASGLLTNFRIGDTFTWGTLPNLNSGLPSHNVSSLPQVGSGLNAPFGSLASGGGLASGLSLASGLASGFNMGKNGFNMAKNLGVAGGIASGLGGMGNLDALKLGGAKLSGTDLLASITDAASTVSGLSGVGLGSIGHDSILNTSAGILSDVNFGKVFKSGSTGLGELSNIVSSGGLSGGLATSAQKKIGGMGVLGGVKRALE